MRPSVASRVTAEIRQFASDIEYYLTQQPRQLPSRYFYDGLGSALFEAICRLPWYRITRAERRLIGRYAHDIFRQVDRLSTLVELGPGNGEKLQALIEGGRTGSRALNVHLIDVSPAALASAARTLGALDNLRVVAHQAPYEAGLVEAVEEQRSTGRTLVLFLGSNIGNFDRPGANALLSGIRRTLAHGDALLVGADLVKPEPELIAAYDDPLGVTAAFNRNLLVRINRELGGDFDLDAFDHRAIWNAGESRVEMHLVSRCRQRVRVAAARLDLTIEAGETIWTESSYKYQRADLVATLERSGFAFLNQWIDMEDGFAITLVASH